MSDQHSERPRVVVDNPVEQYEWLRDNLDLVGLERPHPSSPLRRKNHSGPGWGGFRSASELAAYVQDRVELVDSRNRPVLLQITVARRVLERRR